MFLFDNPQYAGYPPIENVVPVPATLRDIPISPGFIATAQDPVWGPGEFIFARAGGAIRLRGGCVLLPVWDATNKVFTYNMTEWPATAGIGRPLYVYVGNTALTTGQYGWFQMSGRSPVQGNAAGAAGNLVGHAATGIADVDNTLAAGAQILNAIVITPASQTVTAQAVSGVSGDTRIFLSNTMGFFPGVYVSGTGVGAAAICSFVDPLGRYIDVTVANSAAVSGTITATYNNGAIFYPVIEFNRMGAQGQIL